MCGYLRGGETMNMLLNNKNLPEDYRIVANCLRVGKSNAIRLSDIMDIADIKDRRYAYSIIERLINRYNLPIVASKRGEHKGYYYPADKDEFIEAITSLEKNIDSMNKRHNNLIENYGGLN